MKKTVIWRRKIRRRTKNHKFPVFPRDWNSSLIPTLMTYPLRILDALLDKLSFQTVFRPLSVSDNQSWDWDNLESNLSCIFHPNSDPENTNTWLLPPFFQGNEWLQLLSNWGGPSCHFLNSTMSFQTTFHPLDCQCFGLGIFCSICSVGEKEVQGKVGLIWPCKERRFVIHLTLHRQEDAIYMESTTRTLFCIELEADLSLSTVI